MQRITSISLGILFSLALLLLLSQPAWADGTEQLGPPANITIATGTGIVASGTGMFTQPGTIDITVPAGATVKQVLLYWEGQMSTNVDGDNTISVNGTPVTGNKIGGAALFFSGAYSSAFRADITSLGVIQPGPNTVTVDQLTFTRHANGAGIIVIYDDGTTPAVIDLRDGLDLAFYNFPEPRRSTVLQTFTFPASPMTRTAEIVIFASSVASADPGAEDRPDSLEITINGITTIITNPLNSNNGNEWDTVNLPIDIPPNATTMSMQLFSRDDTNTSTLRPASMTWIGAGFAILPPPGAIDIEKATNGQDADLPTGPEILVGDIVTWTYVVTNIGDVDLTNVTVTDNQIGPIACPQTTLTVGASMTCTQNGLASAGQYSNIATVVGTPTNGGPNVTDEDPSHYIGILTAAVGDKVFRDINNNGLQDPGEPGVNGVTVELHRSDGTLVNTMLTTNEGMYLFEGLAPGSYYVTFINTTGTGECTIPNAGIDDLVDSDGIVSPSDPTGATCETQVFPLVAGQTDLSWDLGLVYPATSILLEKATNGEDADLPTGPQIRVGDPVTWTYDVTNAGSVTLTNIALTDDILGVIACPQTTLGPGLTMICTANGIATEGQYANIGTVTGTPIGGGSVVTDTDPSHYTGYIPASVGNFVFGDINPNGTTPQEIGAGNGIQDQVSEEQGIPGIIVRLYTSDGTLVSSTVTAQDGSYLFDNLPPGDYYLVFVNPGTGIWTFNNVGDDTTDSDAYIATTDPDGVALRTDTFTLTSGQTDLTWDAGLTGLSGAASAAAGNRVWVDSNRNGLQDAGEVGYAGATVRLYREDGTFLAETQTDDQGIYGFESLDPGSYYIEFVPPAGYQVTEQKVGTDDDIDSDIDPNTGLTRTFTLIAFETNPRFDLGIFAPTNIDEEEEPTQQRIYLPLIQLFTTIE